MPAPTALPAREVGFSSRLSWSVASRILYLLFLLGFPFCLKNKCHGRVCEAREYGAYPEHSCLSALLTSQPEQADLRKTKAWLGVGWGRGREGVQPGAADSLSVAAGIFFKFYFSKLKEVTRQVPSAPCLSQALSVH